MELQLPAANPTQTQEISAAVYPALCSNIAAAGGQSWWSDYWQCISRAAVDSKNIHFCMDAWITNPNLLVQCIDTLAVQLIKQNIGKNGTRYPKDFCKDVAKQLVTPKTLAWADSERIFNGFSSPQQVTQKCYIAYAVLLDAPEMCSKSSPGMSELQGVIGGEDGSGDDKQFLDGCLLEVVGNGKKHDPKLCDGLIQLPYKDDCLSYSAWKQARNWYWSTIGRFETIPPSEHFLEISRKIQEESKALRKKMDWYDELLKQ